MPFEKYQNFVSTELTEDISKSQTTFSVDDVSNFPQLNGFGFRAVIWDAEIYDQPQDDPNVEVVGVGTVDTQNDTISTFRGLENTSMSPHSSGSTLYHTITAEAIADISDETFNKNISDITDISQYPFGGIDLATPFILTDIAENHGNEAHTSDFVEVGDETSSVVSDTPPNPSKQDVWFSFDRSNTEPNYTEIDGLTREYSVGESVSTQLRTDANSIYFTDSGGVASVEKQSGGTEEWRINTQYEEGASFVLYTNSDGTDVLVFGNGTDITAVNRDTGNVIWTVALSTHSVEDITYDSVNDNLFYSANKEVYGIDTTTSDFDSFVSDADNSTSVSDYNAFLSYFEESNIDGKINCLDIYDNRVIGAASSGNTAGVFELTQSHSSLDWIDNMQNLEYITSIDICTTYGFAFIGGTNGSSQIAGGSLERVDIENEAVDNWVGKDNPTGPPIRDITIYDVDVVSNSYGDVAVFTAGQDSDDNDKLTVYNGLVMETPFILTNNLASRVLTIDENRNLFTDKNSVSGEEWKCTKWNIDTAGDVVSNVDMYKSNGSVWRQI